MTRQVDSKMWANRSQQTTGQVTITFPKTQHQSSTLRKPRHQIVSVQRVRGVGGSIVDPHRYEDEEIYIDREKLATTGRWVLNVIAAKEAYEQAQKSQSNPKQTSEKIKSSFFTRKSSRVEPIEDFHECPYFPNTIDYHHLPYQKSFDYPDPTMVHSTTIGNSQTLSISNSSGATDRRSSDNCSTEEFKNSDRKKCLSKPVIIGLCIGAVLLIIGIILAVFLTIFVGPNQSSTNVSGKKLDKRALFVSESNRIDSPCPTPLFDINDLFCPGQSTYQFLSCSHLVTSTVLTIRFILPENLLNAQWYFDDVSVIRSNAEQLIENGGFESNSTGWTGNSPRNLFVDRRSSLAHSGLAYLFGRTSRSPVSIEQTFDVTMGETVQISFWWKYDQISGTREICRASTLLISS